MMNLSEGNASSERHWGGKEMASEFAGGVSGRVFPSSWSRPVYAAHVPAHRQLQATSSGNARLSWTAAQHSSGTCFAWTLLLKLSW